MRRSVLVWTERGLFAGAGTCFLLATVLWLTDRPPLVARPAIADVGDVTAGVAVPVEIVLVNQSSKTVRILGAHET